LVQLVESAVRSGRRDLAQDALQRLAATTAPSGTDWARGIEARSRALVSDDDEAEPWYQEAIDRLGQTRVRGELARAHLLYGEWLRRDGRRADARGQLRTAHDMLTTMGMHGFAERARSELLAMGDAVRKRTVETTPGLTPQELQIARLAAEGRTNPQIGSQLFISKHTVEYHLRKVFTKLNVSSRNQLRKSLARSDSG
jgi:DNA-binding CsgD family transcriptional regulator